MSSNDDSAAALRKRAERSLGRGSDAVDIAAVFAKRDLVGPRVDETAGLAREALERLDDGITLDDPQRHALELAIRALRPFVLVRDGMLDPLPSDAAAIFDEWESFRARVQPVMRSIGKIVRHLPAGKTRDVATAFVIGEGLVLTNHHVVRQLSEVSDVILPGVASIGFFQEITAEEPGLLPIEGVAAVHPELDAAVLRVGVGEQSGPPIEVPTGPRELEEGEPVAVVGFPLSDPRRPLSITMLDGTAPGKKRGSPGEVLDAGRDTIDHDCSTMPGSSGSPVFHQAGGLVGLHANGDYGVRNGAIRIDRLAGFLTDWTA